MTSAKSILNLHHHGGDVLYLRGKIESRNSGFLCDYWYCDKHVRVVVVLSAAYAVVICGICSWNVHAFRTILQCYHGGGDGFPSLVTC